MKVQHWPVGLTGEVATRCLCGWRPPHQDHELLFKHMMSWVPAVQKNIQFLNSKDVLGRPVRLARLYGHFLYYRPSEVTPSRMVLACQCGWVTIVPRGQRGKLSHDHVMFVLASRCGMQYSSVTGQAVVKEMD